jgi:Acyl-CoA dehydrogenase, C-terminal domain
MDARLTAEQRQLRDAAARLAADLGPGSVASLDDAGRRTRLEQAVAATGWRALRSEGASGVEVAIVAEEFGRGLVDVPFLGPALADELGRSAGGVPGRSRPGGQAWTVVTGGRAIDARGIGHALAVRGTAVLAGRAGPAIPEADPTRGSAEFPGPFTAAGELTADAAGRWHALALAASCADLLGAARGAHALACGYARVREQYGRPIGGYQAVSHPLAEGLALIEGSVSVLRYAAWAVDELAPAAAVQAARIAKVYCARAALAICENAIQVHGGTGNTWDCLAHVYLRRVLTSAELFPAALGDIALAGITGEDPAQPGVAQPGVAQPGVAQPGVAQPGVAQPGAGLASAARAGTREGAGHGLP